MDIKFAIISYKRAGNVLTLDWLESVGIPKDDIIIALNNPDDFEPYKELYGDRVSDIVCVEKDNVGGNSNNVMDYFTLGQRFFLLDDDVRKVQKYSMQGGKYGTLNDLDGEGFLKEAEYMFNACDYHGAEMFGFYPVNNKMELLNYAAKKEHYGIKRLFQGGIMGFKKGSARFDEKQRLFTDYDMQLQYLSRGVPTLRDNYCVIIKKANKGFEGGCKADYDSGKDRYYLQRLKHKYGDLLTIKKGYKGITLNRKAIG